MTKKPNYILYAGLAASVILVAVYFMSADREGEYDLLASCMADSGARMYGTWWCPHCNEQKQDFGPSWNIIKDAGGYVECSTAERTQLPVCAEAGITSYPTWRFGDGTELKGRQDFYTLADRTGCLAELQPLGSN
jgi:hypothetical protein